VNVTEPIFTRMITGIRQVSTSREVDRLDVDVNLAVNIRVSLIVNDEISDEMERKWSKARF
jgi:hypothetical protein